MVPQEKALCYHCGRETDLPYRCNYCNLTFCEEHRLPEAHNCINLPDRSWSAYRKTTQARMDDERKRPSRKYLRILGAVVVIALIIYYFLLR